MLYILNGLIETSQTTIQKINRMLALKDETETKIKEVLGVSYNRHLLQLMFTLPYMKWKCWKSGDWNTGKLPPPGSENCQIPGLFPHKIRRTNCYVNESLIKIFSD